MIRNAMAAGTLAALTACGGRASPPAPLTIDPAVETAAVSATAVQQPMQIVFDWSLVDRDARFSGQGVLRVEPGRARLDLFGPRGETYLAAVLDGMELRLPPGSADSPLPPPTLFWTVIGVLEPPPGAPLTGAEQTGDRAEIRYGSGADAWSFSLDEGSLVRAEWTGAGNGRRTVELSGHGALGVPRAATYRDWPAFLELRLSATDVFEVRGFPNDIWILQAN